jgi:hypothetical protein
MSTTNNDQGGGQVPTPRTDEMDHELHNPRVLQDRYFGMLDHARTLERELSTHARLESENRALREDKARLDWLEANCTHVADSERYLQLHVYWGKGTKHNIRSAIDKARALVTRPQSTP